ncbi:MAG: alpha/beta fold hydrolase [Parachlamydiaceae bacterium]|nr:alpha/beta fold hydrolase [Parachlamydiaceae bacterium]
MKNPIIALHGFLGLPEDWDHLQMLQLHGIDLNSFQWNSLDDCGKHICGIASENIKDEKPILMGYSLGGRIALHALIQQPKLWKAGMIISAHPGLDTEAEKRNRFNLDESWARRFEEEEWDSLIDAWNRRAVFAEDNYHFQRDESKYNRKELAAMLINGSLGNQANLLQQIEELPMPILWVVGEKDSVYLKIAKKIIFKNPKSRVLVVEDAGHRLVWQKPKVFKQLLNIFIENLK